VEKKMVVSERKYYLDGSRLRKVYFAIQTRKRVGCEQVVCQRCRNGYDVWRREMDGDFDDIDLSSTVENQAEVLLTKTNNMFD
jgi:hypothetical protein